MDKQIDPVVQERIRALCGQITVAHDLDAEIQEELYGHMEDKLLAYLAGEEKLSPDDAFILVREHFGDPQTVKGFLQAVHEGNSDETVSPVSLPRRLTAALVALTAIAVPVGLIGQVLTLVAGLGVRRLEDFGIVSPTLDFTVSRLHLAPHLLTAILFWWVLLRWQRRLSLGQRPWFASWPAHRLWMALGLALLIPQAIPKLAVGMVLTPPHTVGMGMAGLLAGTAVLWTFHSISGMAWLWWCDRPPHDRTTLRWAFLSLLALVLFRMSFPSVFPDILIAENRYGIPDSVQPLATGTFFDPALRWTVIWREEGMALIPAGRENLSYALTIVIVKWNMAAAAPIIAYALYALARIAQRWKAQHRRRGRALV